MSRYLLNFIKQFAESGYFLRRHKNLDALKIIGWRQLIKIVLFAPIGIVLYNFFEVSWRDLARIIVAFGNA